METTSLIEVPLIGRIRTDPSGYRQLVQFYNTCKSYFNSDIFIELKDLYHFDANLSALLQAILYLLEKENRLTFSINVHLVEQRFPILFRNGFLSSFKNLPDGLGSTVKMQTFKPNQDEEFFLYIKHRLLNHKKMGLHNCDSLEDQYLEVFSNIQKHAKTIDPIFACGQFFLQESKLYFTLVDLGVGFLAPIYDFTEGRINTAEDAIKWALEFNHSTKNTEQTGGLGLYNLLEHCKKTGGNFNIITGDAYWGNNLGELGTRKIPKFRGTTIHLIYNCK